MSGSKTSEKIVGYATELFRERGYHASSMNDIAKGVGLKKASLYNHFSSKEMIAKRVVEQVTKELKAIFDIAYDENKKPSERLQSMLEHFYQYFQDKNACILASLSMGAANDQELPLEDIQQLKEQWLDAFSHVFQSHHGQEKAQQLARDSLVRIQGCLILRRIGDDKDILRQNLDDILGLLS